MSQPTKKPRTESTPRATGLQYMTGFGGYFSSEAIKGALPERGHTPQQCPYGLYAEQINGTSFTKAKHANQRAWFYRIKPHVAHGKWVKCQGYPCEEKPTVATPEQIRWMPLPMPKNDTDWLRGLHCYCGAGDPATKAGLRIYLYACNKDMVNCSFASSDGDMLFVPEHKTILLITEYGKMEVPPGFVAVVQRGIRFAVHLPEGEARGYVCEVFDNHFELPPLGVIGANGLANMRDFETPVAWYEDKSVQWTCYQKYCEEIWSYNQDHSPFDVVAWHGNYAPYRYDLAKYCVINSVSFDHLDPCIFCVLTAQTGEFGVATCDFVIFPPRWMVAEKTFRPPYYHKNTMNEFMGNIRGSYEAKTASTKGGAFLPGGGSLHSCMAGHGPEVGVFEKCSTEQLAPKPPKYEDLAFMFETTYTMKLTPFAANNLRDDSYQDCWQGFKKHFEDPAKSV